MNDAADPVAARSHAPSEAVRDNSNHADLAAADLGDAPLGHPTGHPERYAPEVLFAVPRQPQRDALGIGAVLPFTGVDVWTAYELTWLDRQGKPQVALATIEMPIDAPSLIESKSMKLYLGSFAQSRFAGMTEVTSAIEGDLSRAIGAQVGVAIHGPSAFDVQSIRELGGESLDELPVACDAYDVEPGLLLARGSIVTETLSTRLFRSVCPVTAQPDIGSVQIRYRGPQIDRERLLRYLVSYRCHAGFHEHCVERIFVDVLSRCRCEQLTVLARFTRRGGLDINPFRTNGGVRSPDNVRTARQ